MLRAVGTLPMRLLAMRRENPNLTARRLANFLLVHLEMRLGRTRLRSRPYELCIDISNKCNLTCPFCPTGRRENGRGRGNISVETFAQILDELGPYAFSLELFNWGEAFFNPDLPRLVEYATRKGVRTIASSNLSFRIPEETARALIRNGLTYLTAAVDGADQASYEVYRRGGNFALVMENLRTFVRLRREMNSPTPRLSWQYLVFAHNENRIEEARRLAAEIGLDDFGVKGGLYEDPAWAPAGNYDFGYLRVHPNRCTWLWNKAVFHWDGGLASCCMGFYKHDDFGDWTPGGFSRLWNDEKFITARRIWTEPDSPLPEGHFCVDCDKVRLFRGLPLGSERRAAGAA
jgi:MoaA/NifB/PqqE/SkfB family radical SAM enzyme